MTKVSVIIPSFNNRKEISRCVNSILNQIYKDFEIIIVDDCSTDDTYEFINKNYGTNNKIKIFRNNENMKAAYTRNKAIEKSSGEYIAIQDADDYSADNRLSEQVNFLNINKDIDFVGSNAASFDDDGFWKKTNVKKNPKIEDFKNYHPFIHASIMFRRTALNDIGGYRVAKETERGQDYDLLMRMYSNGFKGENLENYLYFYYETIETVKKRNLRRRLDGVKIRLKYYPWKNMSFFEKFKLIRTIVIGFIPSSLWYRIMKFRSRKTLSNKKGDIYEE